MNKYQEAIDVFARYISDCKIGIKRYCDREIDTAMAKILELEIHCNELENYCEELEARDEPMKIIVDESPLFNGYPNAHYECPKCHKSLWGDENYCGHCGQRLEK